MAPAFGEHLLSVATFFPPSSLSCLYPPLAYTTVHVTAEVTLLRDLCGLARLEDVQSGRGATPETFCWVPE